MHFYTFVICKVTSIWHLLNFQMEKQVHSCAFKNDRYDWRTDSLQRRNPLKSFFFAAKYGLTYRKKWTNEFELFWLPTCLFCIPNFIKLNVFFINGSMFLDEFWKHQLTKNRVKISGCAVTSGIIILVI